MNPTIVIPARLGSKRIPGKNLANFLGSPIIARPLSECFKYSRHSKVRVVVSSDDCGVVREKLLSTFDSSSLSNLEWHERETSLADDFTTTAQVIRRVIQDFEFDVSDPIFCIYPTSVFFRSQHLIRALAMLEAEACDFVASAVELKNYERALQIDKDSGLLSYVRHDKSASRTQDLDHYFEDAAQLYLGLAESWLKGAPFELSTLPLLFKRGLVWDIDEPDDWPVAERVWQSLGNFEGFAKN